MPVTGRAYIDFYDATTETGDHWASIRFRATGANLSQSDFSFIFHKGTTSYVSVDSCTYAQGTAGYVHLYGVANLSTTGWKPCLRVTDYSSTVDDSSCNLWIVGCCYGVGSRVPDEVFTQAASGGFTKAQGVLTTAHDLDDDAGTMDITQIPRLHGTSAPTSAETILECGSSEIVGLDGSGHVEVEDSTNEANADLTEADGTSRTIRAAWEAGSVDDLYAAVVGGDDGTTTYDGAWPAGNVEIKGTCRATRALKIYDGSNFGTGAL